MHLDILLQLQRLQLNFWCYTDKVLMVDSTLFFFNTETVTDNEFMHKIEDDTVLI